MTRIPSAIVARGLLGALTAGTMLCAGLQAHAQTAMANGLPQVEAEVRKVDLAAGKITLKHGEIPNIDMPPMTMTFVATDPAKLKPFKTGDKVRFRADQVKGTMVVVDIEPAH